MPPAPSKAHTPPTDGMGRIMVPVKFVAEAVGADEIVWNPETKSVTIIKGDDVLFMTIGDNTLWKNGEQIIMDVPAEIQTIGDGTLGRTMLPVAHLAKALGIEYEWDDDTKTVTFFLP